jgi:hypothetical protein
LTITDEYVEFQIPDTDQTIKLTHSQFWTLYHSMVSEWAIQVAKHDGAI